MPPRKLGPQIKKPSRRVRVVLWSVAAFMAVGYFPTIFLGTPVVSIVLAACIVIPYGSKSPTVKAGVIRGACLGAVAGLAITSAVAARIIQGPLRATTRPATATSPGDTGTDTLIRRQAGPAPPGSESVPTRSSNKGASLPASRPASRPAPDLAALGSRLGGGTAALCAAVGGLFAHLARKRRRRIEDEWRE